MLLVTIFLVFCVSSFSQEILKPEHIVNDPDAKQIQVVQDVAQQRKFGVQMALYMRALRPTAAINGMGYLRIRPAKGKRISVAIRFRTFVVGMALVNEYKIADGTLTVKQQLGRDTLYEWAGADKKVKRLSVEQTEKPFAGSDFLIADLGLEMLGWSNQNVIERKLRRGDLCSVLVSRPDKVTKGTYSKVVSWVDEDSMGIVRAELFDGEGKLLKIFEPKSFKKIESQWHVKEMEMRNEQTNTRTSIIFDLNPAVRTEK